MSLFSKLFLSSYNRFKSDDEISLDSLVLLSVDDLKKAIRDEVQLSLEGKISERLLKELTAGKIKEKLKEQAVGEALKISEKYSDLYPKRRNSKLTLSLEIDFVKEMLEAHKSSIELLKEFFDDSAVFDRYYLPILEYTATHTVKFLLRNMQEDAFTYFLKLAVLMTELSHENTYLNDDFAKSEVSLCIVLYASAFVMAKLSFDNTFTCGRDKQIISLFTHSFEEVLLKENVKELTVTATPCDRVIRPEQLISIGLLMLKEHVCRIISVLKDRDCDRLIADLVKPEISSRLFTLLSRARELISKNENVKDCEFLEAVRPVFVGVPHTPENWFSDPKYNGETFFFPEDVLQKVKLHKSICCYVNHSQKAVESFVSSYKKLKEKIALEQDQSQAFKNGSTLLKAAAKLDFKKRNESSDAGKIAEVEGIKSFSSTAVPQSGKIKSKASAPTLEDLMLGDSSDTENDPALNEADPAHQNSADTALSVNQEPADNGQSLTVISENDSCRNSTYKNGQSSLMDSLMSTDAIVNRFSYSQRLSDVTDPHKDDSNALKAFKLIVSKLKDHTFSSNVLKKALDSRISRVRAVIDVVNGFIKDGAFAVDFDLDSAVKNASTYVDYSRALLATRYGAMHNYKRNRVGIDYLDHFIEKEVVFLSKVLKEQS